MVLGLRLRAAAPVVGGSEARKKISPVPLLLLLSSSVVSPELRGVRIGVTHYVQFGVVVVRCGWEWGGRDGA